MSEGTNQVMGRARSREEISAIMRRVQSTGTAPEVRFSAMLSECGLIVETNRSDLLGKPDIVIPSRHIVIFIDGDYWHGGQWRRRGKLSLEEQFTETATKTYWINKIRRNMQRDNIVTAKLLADGWTVLRFWESDIRKRLEACVTMTLSINDTDPDEGLAARLPQMTVAEFFAGIGLMRMGLERSGWQVVFANDIDPQKREMYLAQFSDAEQHFVLGDVHLLPTTQVPSVTLATASFPCNDLSLAGGRAGINGRESSAFWGFVRILQELDVRRPPIVLLENVPGLLTSHKGQDFAHVLNTLNGLGYRVDAFLLDACNFVPQSRQRLFVVGLQESLLNLDNDMTLLLESDTRPKALINFIRSHSDIHWNIRPLPAQPKGTNRLEDILEDLPENAPEWWNEERTSYLLNQMSLSHRQKADRMIANPYWSYGTVFRRMRQGKSMAELRTDDIAGCLRTPRGGSGRQILVKAGFDKFYSRLLTPRECARLMGADEYAITVPLNQALFGFGDAVCAPVVHWIATYYLNPIVNELIHGCPLAMTL